MQTFEILNYAVTPPSSNSPERDRRERRRRIERYAKRLGYKSPDYFEKWLREAGTGYGGTGERNLLDRLQLLIDEMAADNQAAVTMVLLWFLQLYNELMNRSASPIPDLELLIALNETERVLLKEPQNREAQLARLRSLIDRTIGAELPQALSQDVTATEPKTNGIQPLRFDPKTLEAFR